ncbi:hypothetical protein FAUST_7206 [Fusarium austroamericanum]|uniref:MalT-like TPR region domain-containing protein n=1 Tax=Fusarium austroamericanum TaxID=282268 RepID=A0AAN6BZ33_FUSAU|nr:hypothetical protein FAUST_7206 [Fusarium austroamericanum]
MIHEELVFQDGRDSFKEAVAQLKNYLETTQLEGRRKRERLQVWTKSYQPHLLILSDALGSCLVKGVALNCSSGVPANTDFMLFFEDTKEPDTPESISTNVEKVTAVFDRMIRHNPNLRFMTWKATRQQISAKEAFIEAFAKTLEEVIFVAYPELRPAQCSSNSPPLEPINASKTSPPLAKLERYIEVLLKSPNQENSGISRKAKWEDLKDRAESYLERGENKLALAMFQACLKMDLPNYRDTLAIKSNMAFARMILGHYIKAENEFHQLRLEVGHNQDIKPTIDNIHGTILLNHALALSRLGKYREVESCLNEIILQPEWKPTPDTPIKKQQKLYMLLSTFYRLQALAVAHREYISPAVDGMLRAADTCFEKIQDVRLSEPVRISNVLNRCRIFALRGLHTEALSLLQPALINAITGIGQKHILTVETALLLSSLQIETGQFSQGRLACERCADVIEDTFGNEHPLALEAEHILISASHQKGMLLAALDDSLSLCHRAQSSVNLGQNHPSILRYMSQLGEIRIECGQYSSAETLLQEVYAIAIAKGLWEAPHPEISRVQSQLALAQFYAGKLAIAEKSICEALWHQYNTYISRTEAYLSSKKGRMILTGLLADLFPQQDLEPHTHTEVLRSLLTAARILSSHPRQIIQALETLKLARDAGRAKLGGFHPLPLMASLMMGEIYSTAAMTSSEETTREEYYGKAMSSFNFVMEQKDLPLPTVNDLIKEADSQDSRDPPGSHEDSNSSSIFRDDPPHPKGDSKAPACGFYSTETQSVPEPKGEDGQYDQGSRHTRMRIFLTEHPIVLSTRQERILICILSSQFGTKVGNVLDFKDELDDILAAQKIQPGQSHRQTVKTLTTLLALELSFPEPTEDLSKVYAELLLPLGRKEIRKQEVLPFSVDKTKSASVTSLSQSHVEHERFLECLLLRERVAGILNRRPDILRDEYLELLRDIKRQLTGGETFGDPSMQVALEGVKNRTETMLREI